MILQWNELVRYYGPPIGNYQGDLDNAGQTTYALICSNISNAQNRRVRSGSVHAERRALDTPLWMTSLRQHLGNWMPGNPAPVVTLAINRSPCSDCARILSARLEAMTARSPAAAQQSRFILAALGAYEDNDMAVRTTDQDLRRLDQAGWELCVLQVGANLSDRGAILQEGLQRLGLSPTGNVKLP